MQKKQILWSTALLFAALIAWKLLQNKAALEAETQLSKITRSFVPVETAAVSLDILSNQLETDGIFMAAKEMLVISETAGRVIETYKNKGDYCREGDPIAKVDDEMLRIELEATQANLAKLRKDRERLSNLIEGDAAPKNKIEDIELGILAAEAKEKGLKKQIANTTLKAPMTGTLGMRFIERGSVIGPGIQIGQMANLDRLFLMVKVTEHDVLKIKKGMRVDVLPDVLNSTRLPGKVTNIGLRSDNTFTYDVEIEVDNPGNNLLRGGMHAKAIFQFTDQRKGLVIPRKAIVGSVQDAKVYVVRDSTAELRAVQIGSLQSDRAEVISGLSAGEEIVLTGQLNLSNGSKVAVLKEQ
ncbi:MAG: efflux RND transporter periplasmic adaptor subunit [Chitinophagales bacterium]